GQVSAQRVYHLLAPVEHQEAEPEPAKPLPAQMIDARLDGIEHTVMRVAKCCAPLPGDSVVGYVTRGRGVTVHMRDCPRIAGEFERIVTIEWTASGREMFPTEIVIESNDRNGLVRDISDAIAAMGLSIVSGEVRTPDAFTALHHWTIKVADAQQLEALRATLSRVRGVRRVSRRRCG
ncbi:bifunctional (p)ppGpp synthetase/guanosine-3',5'-bis(diphosphate) 3'-pyrophosphohydrolase, partial [Candidatus Poribacteria bacterium]|nr:bifunctional (p)ppGpp synthetase/guanosine-3',5'-bis(diphosphate) 3'-pyrophosphohydrolase [Candidatus Poribacteria bacterium]